VYRPLQFEKCSQSFIRAHDVTRSVAAMRVNNPDCSPMKIQGSEPAQAVPSFAEIVRDDFPIMMHLHDGHPNSDARKLQNNNKTHCLNVPDSNTTDSQCCHSKASEPKHQQSRWKCVAICDSKRTDVHCNRYFNPRVFDSGDILNNASIIRDQYGSRIRDALHPLTSRRDSRLRFGWQRDRDARTQGDFKEW